MLTLFFLQEEVDKIEEVCIFTEEPHLSFRWHPFSEGSPKDQVHKHILGPDLHPHV